LDSSTDSVYPESRKEAEAKARYEDAKRRAAQIKPTPDNFWNPLVTINNPTGSLWGLFGGGTQAAASEPQPPIKVKAGANTSTNPSGRTRSKASASGLGLKDFPDIRKIKKKK
jgi:hypothetical protein